MESFVTCSKLPNCHGSLAIILSLAFLCTTGSSTSDDFIKNSCRVTRYPDLCYEALSAYNSSIQDSPTQLANAALNVTLESAQLSCNLVVNMTKSHTLRPKQLAGAIKDCLETMKDSVDELQQSLMMMRDLEGPDFEMKMSNIQTWVSAALTDEDTCMEGFEGKSINGKVKDTIRSSVERLAQLTSNALALVNNIV